MQAIAQKVVMQAALIGSVSAGSYVFRKLKKIETNEFIANTVYLKENPELCYILNGIFLLQHNEIFQMIVIKLEEILIRENRIDLYKKCLNFLNTRVELDLALFKDDIWAH